MQYFYLPKIKISPILFLMFIFSIGKINAQEEDFTDNKKKYQLHIKKASDPILLDGQLLEATWQSADMAENFWMKGPTVGPNADPKSEVKMTYDDKYLYVGIVCYGNDDYIVQTLKRDQGYWEGDNFGVLLDPVGESSNGFMFGVSPLGVQMEGLLIGGSNVDLDRNWDNKWFAQTKTYPDKWVAEMAIPFKSIRYGSEKKEWRINFIRNNISENEYHSWSPVPQQFIGIDLNFCGSLIWDEAPKKTKSNIALIPYITGGVNHNIEDGEKPKGTFNAGLDAKFSVTSSLNLDLTINPDFSQIEVDQQVTNLSRFSIFLPEKRTFFLDNADIFSTFGIRPIRPLFSRTIGLNEDGETVPILFGARLSGNLDGKTRIGVMNMQTKGDSIQLGQNYGAVAVHRRIGARSLVKGIFVNRQSYEDGDFSKNDFGRNAGVEIDLNSKDGMWYAFGGYHHSFRKNIKDKNTFTNIGAGYAGKQLQGFTSFAGVGENYFADMGFVARIESFYRDTTIRRGFLQNYTQVEYTIFPENDEVINTHQFGWENFVVYFSDNTFSERSIRWRYFMRFKNRSQLRFRLNNEKTNLIEILSITGDDDIAPGIYNTYSFNMQYDSDGRKRFNYGINFRHGGFYHGTLTTYELNLNYRQQPWGNFTIGFQKNDIRFPDFDPIELIDINSRFEINFSKKMFWTTFTQYNFQNNQFNINSRLQYRFSPMSDFFIVYTDNYNVLDDQNLSFLETIQPKSRALVFKMNYWFSL